MDVNIVLEHLIEEASCYLAMLQGIQDKVDVNFITSLIEEEILPELNCVREEYLDDSSSNF